MVTTLQKAMFLVSPVVLAPIGTNAAIQAELPSKYAAIQVSGCSVPKVSTGVWEQWWEDL